MSATYRSERDRGIKEYRQQLAELRKKWPLAFPVHDEDVRPLAVDAAHEMARNAFGSNGTFFAFFVMTDLVKRSKPVRAASASGTLASCRPLRTFARRQDQVHGRTPAVALPLELTAELLGEAFDQPAAEPGIGASRIGPLAVVCDRQAKFPRRPL
jgi:hypothetical protein